MGITIIRKGGPTGGSPGRHESPRIALVLAGGAISGGAFKIGGLIALNCYLKNRKVTDFDMYVGISAGAFLAAPLAAGLPPEELLKSLHGQSKRISRFKFTDFYYPNWRETVTKLWRLSRDAFTLYPDIASGLLDYIQHNYVDLSRGFSELARKPTLYRLEELLHPVIRAVGATTALPHGATYVPGGLFDNTPIERFIRKNLERNRFPNSFKLLRHVRRRDLYIGATSLDTADEVVFGPDERNDLTISEAVQASTALPLFYRPARIRGEDFLDAAVRRTANVTFAASKGANLIICYNPFRPFRHSETRTILPKLQHLGDLGMFSILNQAIRAMLHSRLELGLEAIRRDPDFHGDIVLIEPLETDAEFFAINPVAFWRRAESAEHGFITAKVVFEQRHEELQEIFGHYGLEVDLRALLRSGEKLAEARYDDRAILNLLEQPSIPRRIRPRLATS